MTAFLKANPKIDLLFAHNDDMGLGAIDAIEAAGLKPGVDIKIVTIDAVHDGMAGSRRRQDQLHRRVQPAARAATDGSGQEGRRRQVRPAPHRHEGDHVHAGAGEGSTADPQVLRVGNETRMCRGPLQGAAAHAAPSGDHEDRWETAAVSG